MNYEGPRLKTRDFYPATSFLNAPLPDNVRLNTTEGPAATAGLVAAVTSSKNYDPTFAASSWTRPVYVLPADYPRVPVRLWRAKWATTNPAVLVQKFASIVKTVGVPIPPDYQAFAEAAVAAGKDTDLTFCAYQPDLNGGTEWNLWRAKPCDPASNDGCAWTAEAGLRIAHVDQSPGYCINRMYGGTYYTPLPADPVKLLDYEMNAWTVSATGISLAATMVTEGDLIMGSIDHALGLIVPDWLLAAGKRWPAQAYDGWATNGPVQEGMRFRVDPAIDIPALNLHPIAEKVFIAGQRYGFVVRDKGGALQIEGDPGTQRFMAGTPGYRIFDRAPWGSLQLLATGTAAEPNPTG